MGSTPKKSPSASTSSPFKSRNVANKPKTSPPVTAKSQPQTQTQAEPQSPVEEVPPGPPLSGGPIKDAKGVEIPSWYSWLLFQLHSSLFQFSFLSRLCYDTYDHLPFTSMLLR